MTSMQIERRFGAWDRVALRAAGEDDPAGLRAFTGHAAVFNTPTLIGSKRFGFLEQIDPAAFDSVLDGDTRFLHNHDPNLLLARTTNGTLRLATDKDGLGADADWADTSLARDLQVLVDRGDITQMSFAFTTRKDSWEVIDDDTEFAGMELRTVLDVDTLYDVSTVTYAAYPTTDAGLRGGELCVARYCTPDVVDHVRSGLEARRGRIDEEDAARAALAEARARFIRDGDKVNSPV